MDLFSFSLKKISRISSESSAISTEIRPGIHLRSCPWISWDNFEETSSGMAPAWCLLVLQEFQYIFVHKILHYFLRDCLSRPSASYRGDSAFQGGRADLMHGPLITKATFARFMPSLSDISQQSNQTCIVSA